MASAYSESEPVLVSRLSKAGFDQAERDLILKHVKSLKQLAFVSSFAPGAADEGPLIEALKAMLGKDPEMSQKAAFRAVFHEAYAIVTSEMRQQVERVEEPTVRHLSQPERAERIERQRSQLTGITIKGSSEPSEALVDLCVGQYEANVIQYVPWSKCTSREQELLGDGKKDLKLSIDGESGKLKVENKAKDQVADTSTEVMLLQALQRRALAFDQANIVSFTKLDMWHQKLMKARLTPPPPGYQQVTFTQLQNADSRLFLELQDHTRTGIQSDAKGRPIDGIIDSVSCMHEVVSLMQPLQGGPSSSYGPSEPARLRDELRGCNSHTAKGHPICYAFNLGSCPNKVTGNKCEKGLHICAVPKCGMNHAAINAILAPSTEDSVAGSGSGEGHSRAIQEVLKAHPEGDEPLLSAPEGAQAMPFEEQGSNPLDPKVHADSYAEELLSLDRNPTAQELIRLFDMLPQEPLLSKTRDDGAAAFSTGAYVKGPLLGLRSNCSKHPAASKIFAQAVQRAAPGMKFSTLSVFSDLKTEPHVDRFNSPFPNILVPLSNFRKGEVWVESAQGVFPCEVDGVTKRGILIDVASGPKAFYACSHVHATRPWSGRRVVIVGFCIARVQELDVDCRARLAELDFPVPQTPPNFSPDLIEVRGTFHDLRSSQVDAACDALPAQLQAASLLCLDLFCNAGEFGASLKAAGFDVLAIEQPHLKQRALLSVVSLDLRKAASWDFLVKVVLARRVVFVLAAPTVAASSGDLPEGFAQVASELSSFLALLATLDIGWGVLNPLSSRLWATLALPASHVVKFDLLAHGGEQHQHMLLHTNVQTLSALAVPCDESQKPLKTFRSVTSLRDRPRLLCSRFAAQIVVFAGTLGFAVSPDAVKPSANHRSSIAVQRQPKVSKAPPLMPEYKHRVTLQVPSMDALRYDAKNSLTAAFQSVPVGARILQVVPVQGGEGPSGSGFRVTFGVYRTEDEFVRTAVTLSHPFDLSSAVPDEMLEILAFTLTKGPLAVMRHRLDTLTKWKKWSQELRGAEASLHARLHPDVEKIVARKNLTLLRRVAEDLQWPDATIIDDIENGFELVGEAKVTGIFEVDPKPSSMSVDELLDHAKFLKPALWGKVSGDASHPDDQELWDLTCAEADEKGWLHGPYTWEQLQNMFDSKWIPVRRFSIRQKNKLRPIDDLSENAVNQAWTVMERIGLRALDEITWACMALMRASLGRREVFFRKSDGSVLSGPLHSYWQQDTRRCSPVLKTTDLRSAYKQFAIRPGHHRMCVVTLKDPADGLTKGFVCRVLPFGALASVGQFNRFSRLWQRILWELKLAAASYFDDFPSVEVRALAENHDSSVKAALRLFGVDWASDKDLPFSQTADVLGVRLDATDTEGGVLRVRNKPERSKEIASSIDKILADGCIDPKQIPSLFGRIQFSESQLMGRQGRLALAQIRWLSSARHRHVLSSLDATVFRSLRERMLEGRPREIQVLPVGGQTLVFTDGACDKLGDKFSCSIGGVMYRVLPTGSYETRAFGCYLDESVVEQWAGLGKRHLIGPTELFAVVAARRPDMVVFYVDHSGVLSAMIKGSSRDDLWRSILLHYECADSLGPAISWFARVPSKSNPGDGPSRSDWRFPVFGEYFEDRIVCFISGRVLKVTGQREAVGQLKYLSPDKCVSRLHEVTHAKDSSRQVEIDQSRLIIKETQDEFSMPASSALQVQEALRRRGLAYTFAQAVSWNAYDKYVTKLFGHMHRDPPPNHNRIFVSQIVEADRLVFTRLIELNIKPKQEPSGARPMDEALHAALESYQVSFALMHLASKGSNTPRRPWKRPRVQPDAAAASVNPDAKKGKGKGKKGKAAPWISIPKFIRDRGGVAVTPAGEPICFTYSIHGKCNTPGCTRKHAAASGCATGDAHIFEGHGPVKLDPVLFSGLCEEFGRQVPFVDHPAEALARTILDSKSFEFTCIAELVSLLPSEAPARSDGVNPGGHSWTSGAYVLGGNLGARSNMKLFPAVSALLAVVLRAACDDAVFTSLALLTNQSAWLHRDLNNACESLNTAVALSSFSGGGIWVQGTGDVFAAPSGVSSFPVVLEIFSGVGRLTAQLRARGASGSLAVDSSQVSAPAAPPKVLDVATNQQLLSSWLEADHVVGVHFAPPVVMSAPLERAVQYLVSRAVELALLVSIELPATSTFWSSAAGRKVRSLCPYLRVFPLADCADANASSLLVSNRDVFDGFATAAHGAPAVSSETAQLWDRTYTWEVAAKLADGFVPRRFLFAAPQVASTRAATMSQPKASKFPALVSEHQQVLLVRGDMDWPVARMERLKSDLQLPPHLQCPLRVLPTGAQLLREFVAAAIRAGHPCKWEAALPQVLQDAIQRNASSSAEQLARDRALFFKTWLSRAKELESEEASFKASLAPHVSSILAPKRLLLFKELLSAYEYPDPEVFDEITRGIRLTGQTPNTGIFPPTFKPAVRQAVDLEQWAPGARSRVLECIKPQGDVDAVVHEKTVEEREKGWECPFKVDRMICGLPIDSCRCIQNLCDTPTSLIGTPLRVPLSLINCLHFRLELPGQCSDSFE
ncbi:unnamed protein product [Symbiodinium sp. CCMP2592]|nr:unnamed protein product [Symbiodinium sp. CCMP2592]